MTNQNTEPRKRLLALDTSTAVLGVAVTENGELLHEINASGERNHSVHLLPIIEQALQATGTTADMLGGISVGVGPGSYTGTRIAVTAAKTLAWAWNVPVVGISSLHAVAWGGYQTALKNKMQEEVGQVNAISGYGPDWIIPLMDARRGQVYTGLFAAEGNNAPSRLEPDAIRLMADWVEYLGERLEQAAVEGNKPAVLWFVGETAVHGSEESLRPLTDLGISIAVPYEMEGRWTGFLGEARLQVGNDDIHSLIPNYTQISEAEANLRLSREGGLKETMTEAESMRAQEAELVFRLMKLTDIPDILIIEREAFTMPWTEEAFRNELTHNHFAKYMVMELAGHIIGYAGMWAIVDEAHVTNIALLEAYRGRKWGERLLEELMKTASYVGMKSITLEVRVSNEVAQNLYRKKGFRSAGTRKGYYSDNREDALIMWADLPEYEEHGNMEGSVELK